MEKHAFVESRGERADGKYLAAALFKQLQDGLTAEAVELATSGTKWDSIPKEKRGELYIEAARKIFKAGLSDLYDSMAPHQFAGVPDAEKVAQALWTRLNEGTGASPWVEQPGTVRDHWTNVVVDLKLSLERVQAPVERQAAVIQDVQLDGDRLRMKFRTESGQELESVDHLQTIREERSSNYGPAYQNHDTVGRMWAGMIHQAFGIEIPDLPASLVALMMVALKLNRLCFTPDHADSFDDAINYLHISRECAEQDARDEALADRLAGEDQSA